MLNSIFLKRKNKVVVNPGNSELSITFISTCLKNLETYGYTLSQELVDVLVTLEEKEFESFYKTLISDIKVIKGATVEYKPLFEKFPFEHMEEENSEAYYNEFKNFLASVKFDEKGNLISDVSLNENDSFSLSKIDNLVQISLGTVEDYNQMIKNLVGSKTSISSSDKEDILNTLKFTQDVKNVLPEEIPFKEILIFVINSLIELGKSDLNNVSYYFKSPTDVLRFAVSMSDGDVSLAEKTRFKSFKKSERRFMLSLLNDMNHLKEDMKRHSSQWKRLGEKIHPGDFSKKYPKAYDAFKALRENQKIVTFDSKVESFIKKDEPLEAAKLLAKKPGQFARKIDQLLRFEKNQSEISMLFLNAAKDVPTPILLSLITHFKERNNMSDVRIFFPKGNVSKAYALENKLPSLDDNLSSFLANGLELVLVDRFKELPELGKIKLDARLKDYTVPFSQRTASKSLKTISRGSSFDFGEGEYIRFFTWWNEKRNDPTVDSPLDSVDLDLSALFVDENWNFVADLYYGDLQNNKIGASHSGDILSAPEGASEFIDINISKALQQNVRYIFMTLHNYSNNSFADIPECFAGWMIKENNAGKLFDPKSVEEKFDLTSASENSIPVIFDLVERKVIWCDLSLNRPLSSSNNIEATLNPTALLGKAMTEMKKPNLYDLFRLHSLARGEIVVEEELKEDENFDTVFSISEGVTPSDFDVIVSEFL